MKKFREYISEEVVPSALVANGSIDIDNEAVRASINLALAKVTADGAVTPYIALNRISKALAYFHIILPKRIYLEGGRGVEVHEIRQFGHKMGMTDQGEFVHDVPGKYYLFMQYGMNNPMTYGGQLAYTTMGGTFRVMAKVVDQIELDHLMTMAELSLAEECGDSEHRQMAAKINAPHETMHDVSSDEKKVGNKKAVAVSQKGLDEEEELNAWGQTAKNAREHRRQVRLLKKKTKATFPNVKHFTSSGHPDWEKHGIKDIPTVKEEQLDELSKGTLKRYVGRALNDVRNSNQASVRWGDFKPKKVSGSELDPTEMWNKHKRTAKNREQGIRRAVSKLEEDKSFSEMTPSEKMQWMKDQVQKGKDEKKRLRKSLREKPKKNVREESLEEGMKIVSKGYGNVHVVQGGKTVKKFTDPRDARMFVSQQGKKKAVKEEQLDEISKALAQRYGEKAYQSAKNAERGKADFVRQTLKSKIDPKFVTGTMFDDTIKKRVRGMSSAAKIVTRPEPKRIKEEQLDELSREKHRQYLDKATTDFQNKIFDRMHFGSGTTGKIDKDIAKRKRGIQASFDKLAGRAKVSANEETQIDELYGKGQLRQIAKSHYEKMKASGKHAHESPHAVAVSRSRNLEFMAQSQKGAREMGKKKDINYPGYRNTAKVERAEQKRREALNEKLTKRMSAGDIISDFVHSKDPKFEGKSKKIRQKMALGAYYSMHPEKSDRLDEISKETLGSYVTKASRSVSKSAATRAGKVGRDISYHGSPEYEKSLAKSERRHKGIQRAVDRLTKEELKYDPSTEIPKNT